MGCARRACRVSLNPSTRRSPTAWAWASRSAARSSKPTADGCGRPGASSGVLSFSLPSPLTEPPSAIDVFADELDLATLAFGGVEPEATGRPAYHPATRPTRYLAAST